MAIPIIMGQNIGTCITAVISSIGVSKNAKRVSVVHVYFYLIGTAILLSAFYGANAVFDFAFADSSIDPAGIAIVHSIFNIVTTVVLFPFSKQLEKLAVKTVKDKNEKTEETFIDDRLLGTPALAVSECRNYTVEMGKKAIETLLDSVSLVSEFDSKLAESVVENEGILDNYEDKLGTFLVKVSAQELTNEDSNTVSTLLHAIGDFERIGDHAVNIMKTAKEINEKGISFSDEAKKELAVAENAIREILEITRIAFSENKPEIALEVEPLEQVIDGLLKKIKSRHISRLTDGNCTIELGFILSDLITNYERVSDHCSNIAVCVIRISDSMFDIHQYLNDYKTTDNPEFREKYKSYKVKYSI